MQASPAVKLSEVYETHYSLVYNYVYYRLLHKQNTEDVVSEVFLKVARGLPAYDAEKASIKTWILRITDHALIDYYRRRKVNPSLDDEDLGLANQLSVDFETQYNELVDPERKALYAALCKLSERDRMLIHHRYFERVTNRELAKRLSMNESTVATLVARARKRLKALLEEADKDLTGDPARTIS